MPNSPLSEFHKVVNQKVFSTASDKQSYDFIVVGLGSMGASTCYQLAKQGFSVLGLEKFDITHENGSHAGQSRLIRQAYFEHPDYVPLLKEAYRGWNNLENESNTQLFYRTGILYSGMIDDFLISGSLKSASQHQLQVEELPSNDQDERFPQFDLPSHYKTIFEPNAGFVTPERAILAYINQALSHGADIHNHEAMVRWKKTDNGIEIQTEKGKYSAGKLIITAGAWTSEILPGLQPNLKVTKQTIFWVNVNNIDDYKIDKMPCWGINQEDLPGLFYGFPILDNKEFGGPHGLKIGYHYPGVEVDPEDYTRTIKDDDKEIIVNFMDQFMPGCFKSINELKTCLYTYSADDHFIVDHHPDQKNVLFATGFSGHGFKFIPVIGLALAELAVDGRTALPIEFLRANRLF